MTMSSLPSIYTQSLAHCSQRRLFWIVRKRLAALTPDALRRFFEAASDAVLDYFEYDWLAKARLDQLPPDNDWLIWVLLGGRGSGKTRAGAEWIQSRVEQGAKRIALVGPSYHEARAVMVEGESGLLNIARPENRPIFHPSRRRLEWPNGAVAELFSGDDPQGLRGPQFDTAWADEFCAWTYPHTTLSNLRLGLRLPFSDKSAPRLTVTTTPKPTQALKSLLAMGGVHLSRAKTSDNAANLAPGFIDAMQDSYGGTRLGRQELEGLIVEDYDNALFTRAMMGQAAPETPARSFHRQDYERVIIAVDPPATKGAKADACGIIVMGSKRSDRHRLADNDLPHAYLLVDGTVQGESPAGWAERVAMLYQAYDVDYIVAESNQGGEMVRSVLGHANPDMTVRLVHASKSKTARAAPVALLYEQKRVHHLTSAPMLEDQLCALGTAAENACQTDKSPDRADALVWAVHELLETRAKPRIYWPQIPKD